MNSKTIILAFVTISVLICISLAGVFALVFIADSNSDSEDNIEISQEFSADINIFFEVGTDEGYVLKIKNIIEDINYVQDIEFTSEVKAYNEYKDYLEQSNNQEILDVLNELDEKILPSSLNIDLKDNSSQNKSDLETLIKALDSKGNISDIKY